MPDESPPLRPSAFPRTPRSSTLAPRAGPSASRPTPELAFELADTPLDQRQRLLEERPPLPVRIRHVEVRPPANAVDPTSRVGNHRLHRSLVPLLHHQYQLARADKKGIHLTRAMRGKID